MSSSFLSFREEGVSQTADTRAWMELSSPFFSRAAFIARERRKVYFNYIGIADCLLSSVFRVQQQHFAREKERGKIISDHFQRNTARSGWPNPPGMIPSFEHQRNFFSCLVTHLKYQTTVFELLREIRCQLEDQTQEIPTLKCVVPKVKHQNQTLNRPCGL